MLDLASDIRDLVTSQKTLIEAMGAKRSAEIVANSSQRPRLQVRIPLDLATAQTAFNPLAILDPFTGFYVESATDDSAAIRMSLTSSEKSNLDQYTTITRKDSGQFDQAVRGCFLTWDAQAGKTLTLVLYLGVSFRPGSQISSVSGGVNLTTGTGMTPKAVVQVTTTATQIFAGGSSAKKRTIVNYGGATIYISGTSAVVATTATGDLTGIPVAAGGAYEWINTGACYAITAAGTAQVGYQEEL